MGRATRDNPLYQDDPDAVSLHTTPDDYNYDDAPELSGLLPPSYADSENASTPTTAVPAIRHITPVTTRKDHNRWYELSGGVPKVCDTVVRMDPSCDTDPVALQSNILSLAHNPPIPLLYIMGTHKETVKKGDKKETQTIVDFRIVINMRKYLSTPQAGEGDSSKMTLHTIENGEKTYRGSFMKKRAPGFKQDIEIGSPKPTLTEWCHRYCASPSMLRIFRMSHTISGFDETFLKNRIDGMLRSTNYRGHISVTFPIEDVNLDFYTSNWINQWRMKTWVCWIFYLTFLWIFTWPYLYFATKRWYVIKADWAFSTLTPNGKIYTHMSESDWFEKWSVGIRRLALDRYQGEATEPQLEGVMARPEDPPMPVQIQPINLGSVRSNPFGALSQGIQIAGALSRGTVPGTTNPGWGYDT